MPNYGIELVEKVREYYRLRKLVWPSFSDAMKFVHTEIGEVYELDLDRCADWVRNNPDLKPKFNKEKLSEELGDVIFMLLVAGIVEGVNPIESLNNKMNKVLEAKDSGLV